MRTGSLLTALILTLTANAAERIGFVELFGYQGLDAEAVRRALPIADGGVFNEKTRPQIRAAVKNATGADPTDIAGVCCDERGHSMLFIGLAGKSTRAFRLNPKPAGTAKLPADFRALYNKLDKAFVAAVKKGGDAPSEDDSQGYALIHDPPAQKLQLQLRDYTRAHEALIYNALENCPDSGQRSEAAAAIGYAQQSPRQIAALVSASHDPDPGVRDEATRALGVLLRADASKAAQIPAADFIEMSASGNWMDRNKASMVLDAMTRTRDPQLLKQIESQAWEPLLEMARWRDSGHAFFGRLILGRIRGIEEDRLTNLASGPPEPFLAELEKK